MSRSMLLRLILIISLLLSGGVVLARDVLRAGECTVSEDTVIDGTLFVLCQDLHIDGRVNGDVIGAAVRTEINGDVFGNVYLLSSQLDVRGRITKDLHFGGVVLRLNPPLPDADPIAETEPLMIGSSVKAIALSIMVDNNTTILDGILGAGYQLIIHGDVRDEITFWGSNLFINGDIEGDIFATVGNPEAESRTLETLLIPFNFDVELLNPGLLMSETAHINGNLQYKGPVSGDILGTVTGGIDYQPYPVTVMPTLEEPGSLNSYFAEMWREFTTLLAIGAVAVVFLPGVLDMPLHHLRTRPFSSFSVGMLAFLLSFPIVLIFAVLSVVIIFILNLINLDGLVIAVGVVLGMVNLGGVSLFYFFAIFVARALVGLALGRVLLRSMFGYRQGVIWSLAQLAFGVFIISIFVSLPVLGLLFNAATLFIGLGTILNVLIFQFRRWRDAAPVAAPAWYEPSPAVTRPRPALSDRPRAKVIPVVEAKTYDDEDDDIDDEPEIPVSLTPLPPPSDNNNPYPLVGPGMTNLPEGFDFGFFADDKPDDSSE
jgi:hypothetical protein